MLHGLYKCIDCFIGLKTRQDWSRVTVFTGAAIRNPWWARWWKEKWKSQHLGVLCSCKQADELNLVGWFFFPSFWNSMTGLDLGATRFSTQSEIYTYRIKYHRSSLVLKEKWTKKSEAVSSLKMGNLSFIFLSHSCLSLRTRLVSA